MFYEKKASFYKNAEPQSDGMGGWLDGGEPILLGEVRVASAPVTAELVLKEYGLVSTTSMKLYTEGIIPEGNKFIHFDSKDYRILQISDYGTTKVILMEVK